MHISTSTLVSFALCAVVGVGGSVSAAPPDPTPGATKPVREQNLDGDGLIRVHEQGIADVNVTNEVEVTGTVSVEGPVEVQGKVDVDFPDVQDVFVKGGAFDGVIQVRPATVDATHSFILVSPAEDGGPGIGEETFPTINATHLSISNSIYEMSVSVSGPLGGVINVSDLDGDGIRLVHAFSHPVPINQVRVSCFDGDECILFVTVVGFAP